MIASLPMYDRPETRDANDRLWAQIRARLGTGPERLTRSGRPQDDWRDPNLLLSQTCSLPFRAGLHESVTLVATPDHGIEGCRPGYYRSAIVVRGDDPRTDFAGLAGARYAFNSRDSQSGWAALATHAATCGVVLGAGLETGSHRESARKVAEGHADLAALDAVSWAMIRRADPAAAGLRILCMTEPTPALPYITARPDLAEELRGALTGAIAALSPEDREALHLRGIVRIPASSYLELPLPPGS